MNGKPWTHEENNTLKRLYPDLLTSEISKLLPGRTSSSISGQASKLGIKKSKEHLSKLGVSLKVSGAAHRYPKGNVPINKGKVMTKDVREKIKHTFFKKGHRTHNTKPVGTISERQDNSGVKYKYIKIADNDWQLTHRMVWEQHNGPIPKGNRIHFIDKNTLNCGIENLKCLSAQEAMDMNRISDLPVELQEVIKLKNKLTRKIKSHGTK